MRKYLLSATAAFAVIAGSGTAFADAAAAQKWIDQEFQPSTLSKDEQMGEMQWFIDAAAPYAGMEINVLSEGIPTHGYESEVLTKAFEEITGIKVNHQILGEGEVVQAVQTQMQTQRNLYDGYVNDSDLIGTHSRLQLAYNLTDQMAGDWAATTSPTLDLDDFMGIQFTTGPDGDLYQLPDQQFANLYWFRKDWFDRRRPTRPPSRPSTATSWAFRSTGRPMRTSPISSRNDVKEVDGVTHLWPHGLRQTRAGPGLADDRRMAVDGRRRIDRANRTASRSTNGASAWKRAPVTRPGRPSRAAARPTARRRSMRSASGTNGCATMRLRALRPTTSTSRCRPWPGQRGPADLLVHRVHRRHGEAEVRRQQHRRRRRQPAVADGARPAWPLLERRPEGRLSGRWVVDLPEIHPRRTGPRRPGFMPSS